jgi:hypothetical protein
MEKLGQQDNLKIITMNDERKMFIEKISAKYLGQES